MGGPGASQLLLFHYYQATADNVVKSLFPGGKASKHEPDQQYQE